MRSTSGEATATAYLQVVPDWGYGTPGDQAPVLGARILKATQSRPTRPDPDAVVVKVTVTIPKIAFYPIEPAALVVVPEELVQRPVTVTAEDSSE